MSTYDWHSYEEEAHRLMQRHQTPGAAVGVAKHGKPIYLQGLGFSDVEKQKGINEETIFGIGSVTKSFTAVAIMQLQERGLLSVSDCMTKYLPDLRVGSSGAEQGMKIHHFLTHTTGLPPLPSLTRALLRSFWIDETMMEGEQAERLRGLEPIDTDEDLIRFIADSDVKLLGNPGEYFSYSNDCYAMLGTIITRVSGETYEEYVEKNILKPLEMNRSFFDAKRITSLDNVANLYSSRKVKGKDQIFAAPVWWASPAQTAAGFLKSTVSDMLRYMDIYRTGGQSNGVSILSEKSINQMCSPYAQPLPGRFYGYGLDIHRNYQGASIVEHGGNIKGVAAWACCIREKGITGVTLANRTPAPSGDLVLGAVNNVLGIPVRTRRYSFKSYACPEERLHEYAGAYTSGEGSTVKVRVLTQGLEFEMAGERVRARPVGVDAFAMRRKGLDSEVRFIRNHKGEPWALAVGYRMLPKAPQPEDNATEVSE